MHEAAIIARHYRTGEAVRLTCHGEILHAIERVAEAPPHLWICPALFDPQINGYGGVDFQRDELGEQDLLQAVRPLRQAGCARFFPTLITDTWPLLLERLRHLRQVRSGHPDLERALAGWHIEGPFLSAEKGYRGAHPAELMCDASPEQIHALRRAAGEDRLLITLAPERTGALAAIRTARECGMVVSLGHTNASPEQILAAFQAGASGFTHLGNGCPQELDRHDNILWRVLDGPELMVSLIPDGHHVSPALFRLAHRALPVDRLCYTTDAMSAAGAPPGLYPLGRMQLEVGSDGIVRQPGETNFAGSALQPVQGILRACRMLGRRWQELWDLSSVHPARWAGVPSGLAAGKPAQLCLIRTDPHNQPVSLQMWGPEGVSNEHPLS